MLSAIEFYYFNKGLQLTTQNFPFNWNSKSKCLVFTNNRNKLILTRFFAPSLHCLNFTFLLFAIAFYYKNVKEFATFQFSVHMIMLCSELFSVGWTVGFNNERLLDFMDISNKLYLQISKGKSNSNLISTRVQYIGEV